MTHEGKKEVQIIKDKHNWWLIDGRIQISITFNNFIEEQIIYLTNLYEELGYNITIDRNFENTY